MPGFDKEAENGSRPLGFRKSDTLLICGSSQPVACFSRDFDADPVFHLTHPSTAIDGRLFSDLPQRQQQYLISQMADKSKSTATSAPAIKPHQDFIRRGVKTPSPAGTAVFVILRLAEVWLQYELLRPGGWGAALLGRWGAEVISDYPRLVFGVPLLDDPALSPARWLLLAMAAGQAAKQIVWLVFVSEEEFPVMSAVFVVLYNAVLNSADALLLLAAATSSTRALPWIPVRRWLFGGGRVPVVMLLGGALFWAGLGLELVAELQRKAFKSAAQNRGKVCRVGIWAYVQHPNYGGYMLWRAGHALASSGWVAGAVVGLVQWRTFAARAIPAMDEYCGPKYGEQWKRFRKEVPWKLVPGLY